DFVSHRASRSTTNLVETAPRRSIANLRSSLVHITRIGNQAHQSTGSLATRCPAGTSGLGNAAAPGSDAGSDPRTDYACAIGRTDHCRLAIRNTHGRPANFAAGHSPASGTASR